MKTYRILGRIDTNFEPGGKINQEISYIPQKRLFGFLWWVNMNKNRYNDVYDAYTVILKDRFYKQPEVQVLCNFR